MFCPKCGQQMADDALFCGTCGYAVANTAPAAPAAPAAPQGVPTAPYGAPAAPAAPVAPAQPNPMFANFVSVLKEFWINPVATVGKAAKRVTHEWCLLAAIAIVTYALSTALGGQQLFGWLLGGFGGMFGLGSLYPFALVLLVGLLVGAVSYFGTAAGLWLLMTQIFKKQVSLIQCFNMVAVASLPLAVVHVLNLLVGLIYAPLVFVFALIGLMLTTVCLYTGVQKLEKLDKSPFYGFAIVTAAVVLVTFLFSLIYFAVGGSGAPSSDVGDAMEIVDDVVESFDDYDYMW